MTAYVCVRGIATQLSLQVPRALEAHAAANSLARTPCERAFTTLSSAPFSSSSSSFLLAMPVRTLGAPRSREPVQLRLRSAARRRQATASM